MKRILIPLDGSELSDRVLLNVRRFLLGLDSAMVVLLRVIEPMRPSSAAREERPDTRRSPAHISLRKESARRHLEPICAALREEGVEASAQVLMGDAADVILRRAESERPDLVAMATHGRSGISRWIRGSVAERVLRRCPVPLLLYNPDEAEGHAQGIQIRRILVPLDGSKHSASVVPLVESFATRYGSSVELMRVIQPPPLPAAEFPSSVVVPLTLTDKEALASLDPHATRLRDAGLEVSVSTPLALSPARAILEAVEANDVDLIAMTTHGSTGIDRWLLGSVAELVARHSPCPLLIKRVGGLNRETDPLVAPVAATESVSP
jgi:nucleotide-binding universal stress UspA family protein